jgi:hypothetical protein
MTVNNAAELRHRVAEDSCELIRNKPRIAEGVRQPFMRCAKRILETEGKS